MDKWNMVKLSDVFTLQMGKTPSRNNPDYWNGNHKWLSIADFGMNGKYINKTKECITDAAVAESGIKATPHNTVVMSFKLSIGKTAITVKDIFTNEAIMSFIDKGTYPIDVNYIYHLFSGKDWSKGTNKAVMGTTLNKATLSQITIPLPPIESQYQIADNLEKVSKLIDICNTILNKLDILVKSRFVEMFGDPILNPKGWEMTTIGEIVTEVKYGTSRPAIDGGKYAYLRMNNLTYDGYLDLADLKRIDIPDSEIEKCIVRKGDVLFNRTNSIELVGKTCVFDKDEDMIIAGYIIRVRLKPVMLPLIMSYFMNTDALKKKLRSMAKGAVNQANINAQELKAIKIYLPPTDLQQQFADFVAQTDKSKYCLVGEQILGKAEMLIKVLKQEYFG